LRDDCIKVSSLLSNTTPGTNTKSSCFWGLIGMLLLLFILFDGFTIFWLFWGINVPDDNEFTLKSFLDKIYFSNGFMSFKTSFALRRVTGWGSHIFVIM
jgi:hypothetical protein